MAPPSSLPSAEEIAVRAKASYEAKYGLDAPQIPVGIEEQAEYFYQRNELSTVYFRSLVDFNCFAGRPNKGHYALADLFLVNAIQTAVTTNVDVLIENAGQWLYGQIGVGIDGNEVSAILPGSTPLLKIHGCRSHPDCMVWAPGQLLDAIIAARITQSANWLQTRLVNRDLLIVGYWTDWSYLNDVLSTALNAVNPSKVIVVNPADKITFEEKAPALYALGTRATGGFFHVQASGADFLDELRLQFSTSFVRQVLHNGRQDFTDRKGLEPAPALLEPPALDNMDFWQSRRDIEGCLPMQPAKQMSPANDSLIGQTILELRTRGAVAEGAYWNLDNQKIRVLKASKSLHRVQKDHERETAPTIAPDIVIAVGSDDQLLPKSVARTDMSTITRGNASRWMSRPQAVEELDL
jgi:hypothetical protein